jgi:integrase
MATIRQRAGRAKPWQAIVRRVVDGKTVSRSKSFTSERDAQAWARNVEAALDDPKRRAQFIRDKTTIADLIKRYIIEVDPIKPLGRTKRDTLNFLLGCPVSDLVASELEAKDIVAHCTRRQAHGASPATVQQDIIYLRGVFGMAKPAWGLPITTAAFEEAGYTLKKLQLVGKSNHRERRLHSGEWDALCAYWQRTSGKSDIPIREIVEFAIACPLRQGEIMRLRWDDLNSEKRTIIVRGRKHPSKKHDDVVPLLGVAFDIVMRQPRIDELIFPWKQNSVAAAWERARDDCKLVDITFHDLRHHGISLMFEDGYSIEQVAIVSGHRDWSSLKRYANIKPESLHRD